ncbi:MAG TPA: DUF4387 domain-containing protein [Steroidobacter sp.]|uniref:DUF4387 domain-containing protein n=1 Tax=Steroidobacter sp. TaxID=1978227 RepID=UPI002EDB6878
MPSVREVCHVRSKNAGPYWVTVDFFFDGPDSFERFAGSSAIGPAVFAKLYGIDAGMVKQFRVPKLNILKVSYPRITPQGGEVERDMHSGQQFVRLLDIELT